MDAKARLVDGFEDRIASKVAATVCAFPAILSAMPSLPATSTTGSIQTRGDP
jgi:hypothetical protein